MISIYCAHSLFSLCCRVLKHSGTALKEETGDREGIWQHVGLSPQSQIPVCFVLWEAFNPTLQKRNALDSVGARAHPAGLGFRSAIESIVIFNSYNGWRGRWLCWWDYFVCLWGGGGAWVKENPKKKQDFPWGNFIFFFGIARNVGYQAWRLIGLA